MPTPRVYTVYTPVYIVRGNGCPRARHLLGSSLPRARARESRSSVNCYAPLITQLCAREGNRCVHRRRSWCKWNAWASLLLVFLSSPPFAPSNRVRKATNDSLCSPPAGIAIGRWLIKDLRDTIGVDQEADPTRVLCSLVRGHVRLWSRSVMGRFISSRSSRFIAWWCSFLGQRFLGITLRRRYSKRFFLNLSNVDLQYAQLKFKCGIYIWFIYRLLKY